jgi:hypothetical protein
MCDIVNSPCKVCGIEIPLHLGDYETSPDEVECFCGEHLPTENVRVFTLTEDDLPYEKGGESAYKKGWVMGVRSLTPNARENEHQNHPNVAADWTIEVR